MIRLKNEAEFMERFTGKTGALAALYTPGLSSGPFIEPMLVMTEHFSRLSKANFAAFSGVSILSKPLVSSRAPSLEKRIAPSTTIITAKFADILRLSKTGVQYKHLQEIAYISLKSSNTAVN